jgi:hypothetical protein
MNSPQDRIPLRVGLKWPSHGHLTRLAANHPTRFDEQSKAHRLTTSMYLAKSADYPLVLTKRPLPAQE